MTISSRKSDEEPVVIVDEFAEVDIDDPTFDGMRESRIEEAYTRVIQTLRNFHADRYRHRPPADDLQLFESIRDEIDLPHERLIGMLVTRRYNKQNISPQEKDDVLAIVDGFIQRLSALR